LESLISVTILIQIVFQQHEYFLLKPHKENAYQKQITPSLSKPYYGVDWKFVYAGHINKYQVSTKTISLIPRRVGNFSDIEKRKEIDLQILSGTKTGTDLEKKSLAILKANNITSWDELFKLRDKFKEDLSTNNIPIYNHQYNKIVDILHYLFHAKRNYPNKEGVQKFRFFYPVDLIPLDTEIFQRRAVFGGLNLDYIAIKRNKMWSIVFTEKEIQSIYGTQTQELYTEEEEESYERFILSKLVWKKLLANEEVIANTNGLKEDDIYNMQYEENDTLFSLIKNSLYKLENVFIEKDIFFIELFVE
jgi:hypothetical protein